MVGLPDKLGGLGIETWICPEFRSWHDLSEFETNPIAVSDAFAKLLPDGCAPHEVIGFPTSEEQPIGASESGRIQFFKNGVITLQDGRGGDVGAPHCP